MLAVPDIAAARAARNAAAAIIGAAEDHVAARASECAGSPQRR
jgi:hypothetical protein